MKKKKGAKREHVHHTTLGRLLFLLIAFVLTLYLIIEIIKLLTLSGFN